MYYFRELTNYFNQYNFRSSASTIADKKLANVLRRSGQANYLSEACQLVINYPAAMVKLNDNKFYYTELAVQVCDRMDKKEPAKQFAIEANAISKIAKPLFERHETDNTGNLLRLQLRILHEISLD